MKSSSFVRSTTANILSFFFQNDLTTAIVALAISFRSPFANYFLIGVFFGTTWMPHQQQPPSLPVDRSHKPKAIT